MPTSALRAAFAAGVVCLAAAPSALARAPVYGGATNNSAPIVIRADNKAKKLKSAVIGWTARCKSDSIWTDSAEVTAAKAQRGFTPDADELVVSRNKRGKFAGVQMYGVSSGDMEAGIVVRLSGRLAAKKASGTLSASVVLFDSSGKQTDGCETGTVRWSASRAPRRIYGGVTSQNEPLVVRLDRARKKVSDFMFGWGSRTCVPDAYLSYGEFFSNFPISGGRFGDAFSQDYPDDDGSKRTFSYDIAGNVSRAAVRGSLRVQMRGTDPAGAETLSCDSGAVSWKAASG